MIILLIVLILVFGFGGARMGPGLGYYGGVESAPFCSSSLFCCCCTLSSISPSPFLLRACRDAAGLEGRKHWHYLSFTIRTTEISSPPPTATLIIASFL